MLAFLILIAAVLGFNLFDLPFGFLFRIEKDEINEIITAALVVIAAFIVDRVIVARRTGGTPNDVAVT